MFNENIIASPGLSSLYMLFFDMTTVKLFTLFLQKGIKLVKSAI